jgi:DNA end-binding protein Ku
MRLEERTERSTRRRLGHKCGMRSIWKGNVSFGLVSIPVRLYTATEEKDVSFRQVRRSDGSRIRYKRVAEADGEEVQYGDIAKGLELPSGELVVLTDDDFAELPLSTAHVVDVHEFVPLEQVDPIYFAKTYYLEPDKAGVKPYVLLRDALAASGMVALVKVAIRSREQLAVLRVRENVMVLETMVWPDEVRTPDFAFLDQQVDIRPQELQMANSLIDSLRTDFDPTKYSDDYRAALQEVIDAKISGGTVTTAPTSGRPSQVVDLMAALQASVDAAKARRATATASEATTRVNPTRTRTPKKPMASGAKPPTSVSAAKKTAPRKKSA